MITSARLLPALAAALDSAKLDNALLRYNVGSLLNVWDVALTPQEWRSFTTISQRTVQRKRLRIPVILVGGLTKRLTVR